MNRGFTLIELLVTIGLMIFLAGLVVPSWRAGEVNSALNRSAHKLSQDIRRAQELSLRAQAFDDCPINTSITGYGIVFDTSWSSTQYRLFANCKLDGSADDYAFSANDVVLPGETITVERGIKIALVSPTSQMISIVFIPPTPLIFINPGELDSGQIVLARVNDATAIKTITITNKGIIDVD